MKKVNRTAGRRKPTNAEKKESARGKHAEGGNTRQATSRRLHEKKRYERVEK